MTTKRNATAETFQASQIANARIVVTHRIKSGEIRTRIGVVDDVRAVGISYDGPNYVVIHDEFKGTRGFYIDSVVNGEVFFL